MTTIRDRQYLFSSLASFILVLMLLGCSPKTIHKTQTLTLIFEAVVGSEALTFNHLQYPNPGGEGLFKVRDFQFFISNINLVSDMGNYREPDSYHIARFDNADKTYTITIENVPIRPYQKLEFAIGVDPAANSSVKSVGDLDPNSRMAWSWDVGYKFVLFEGGLSLDDVLYPLVYHIGFNENYKTMAFKLNGNMLNQQEATLDQPIVPMQVPVQVQVPLHFKVDLAKLFTGAHPIDMAELPSVKFDKTDAKLIADNYADIIALCSSKNC